jgi:hypothetical protein
MVAGLAGLVLGAGGLLLGPTGAAHADPAVDSYPTWVDPDCWDWVEQPGVVEFRSMLLNRYGLGGSSDNIFACTGFEHGEGRALDFMVDASIPAQEAIGDAVVSWLTATVDGVPHAMARRLGVGNIIWKAQSIELWSYKVNKVWEAYEPCGPYSPPGVCHTNHVHIAFSPQGANRQTSWFTTSPRPAHWYPPVPGDVDPTPPPTTPPSTSGPYYVTTYANAPGYSSATSTTQTGTLYAGTSYVYCKFWGRKIGNDTSYNHWWLKTDLDAGSPWANQYISAYYLSNWGNDEALTDNGVTIPTCSGGAQPVTQYWVTTYGDAPAFGSAWDTTLTGWLYGGSNYVYCKVWGRQITSGGTYNHWWLKTDLDVGSPWQNQYISAYFLSNWGNDEAFDDDGVSIPSC